MKEIGRRTKSGKYTLFRLENQDLSADIIGSFSNYVYFCSQIDNFLLSRHSDLHFALIFGLFVGSIPTTFLLVKWRRKMDVRKEGTGNVGTMNVYEVTNSRAAGIAVLVIDVLKAVAAVQSRASSSATHSG